MGTSCAGPPPAPLVRARTIARLLPVALLLLVAARPWSIWGVSAGTEPRPDTTRSTAVEEQRLATDQQLEWLVESYGATLYTVAVAVTRNRALAEEVVQDSLFQAWVAMPSWDEDVPVRWMIRVTRNRAISVMRIEGRSASETDWDLHPSWAPATERIVEGREAVQAVAVAMSHLDEVARSMLVMRESQGLSYEEIGDVLGLTPSAVKAKLYRARHTLKTLLQDWEL